MVNTAFHSLSYGSFSELTDISDNCIIEKINTESETGMTSLFFLKTKLGAVIATDSRCSLFYPNGVSKYKDGFQKIVYLEQSQFVIANFESNFFNGLPFSIWIKSLDDKLVNMKTKDALTLIAEEVLKIAPNQKSSFIIINPQNLECQKISIQDKNNIKEFSDGAQFWVNPFPVDIVSQLYGKNQWCSDSEKSQKQNECVIDTSIMTFSELCAFACEMVQIHINMSKYNIFAQPVVGGDIQMVAVDLNQNITQKLISQQDILNQYM